MEVLEFGCGIGSTAIVHAPDVKHIQAIDISSKMIEIAQGEADAKNIENVTFQRSTNHEFSVPDQTFDAVLGFSTLHLLENKGEVILGFTKCSGRVAFSLPAPRVLEICGFLIVFLRLSHRLENS